MTGLIISAAVLLLIILYVIITHNKFIKLVNAVEEGFSTMDVYLKKRWDLIPNLVETIKGYTKHEEKVLSDIVKLRSGNYDNKSTEDKIDSNNQITETLGKLFALAESYPDLKANENFMQINSDMNKIEEDIANSRKYYNAVVKKLNNAVQMIPSSLVASIFKIKSRKMFEAATEQRENVKVKF